MPSYVLTIYLLAKTRYFYLSISILAENANPIQIFCQQFVSKFDTPKNPKLAKIFILKFMFKWPHRYQQLTESNK